jgi:uracil-DNA glycosylase
MYHERFRKMRKSKVARLNALEAEMMMASLPLGEANLVFGEGNPDCEVMFIGEAPGSTEDRMKRPFVGRAGRLLDRLIEEIGWKRNDVYITNIVKRRPPENRAPQATEIKAYEPYLARQIEIIDPRVIVTLGRFAMGYFLPGSKISLDHGHIFAIGGRHVFPVYHPAAALRSSKMRDALRKDFGQLPKVLFKAPAL